LPALAAEVVFAAREEMARSVEDVLARRTRMLFLNAKAALAAAPRAAELLARELGRNEAWIAAQLADFERTAAGFMPSRRGVCSLRPRYSGGEGEQV
jgi:glycerol-3-phosphate dehydrogenase